MTRALLTEVDYSAGDTEDPTVPLERLEYGKFCVSADGPIERTADDIRIGYSQLGWSDGFPEVVIPLCDPNVIGISEGESDAVPTASPHGTVLRAIVAGEPKRPLRIFYRVRSRAENGEGKSGRRYTMARYLVAPQEDVGPMALLNAMDAVSFRGLTRADSANLPTCNVSRAEPQHSDLIAAFLRQAVIFILSGIPLSITEDISEIEFFTLASTLWASLPPALRIHLSAGWNVGSSYSGRLTMTRTAHRAVDTALFSSTTGLWSPPDYVIVWNTKNERVREGFVDQQLEPGRFYTEYIFEGAKGEWPADFTPAPEKLADLIRSFPVSKLPPLPDWHDSIIVGAFRYPGSKARDHFALSLLDHWLLTGAGADHPRLSLDVRGLTYQSVRLKALNIIIKALAQAETRDRGDQALWHSLLGKRPNSFNLAIEGAQGPGADRVRLIAAIAAHDTLRTLQTLALATRSGEADKLPEAAVATLERVLDASLQTSEPGELHVHASLVLSPPAHYRHWVQNRALYLMSSMASKPEAFNDEVYAAISKISQSEDVLAFYELVKAAEPSRILLAFVAKLPEVSLNLFRSLFIQEWKRRDEKLANRRERLGHWADTLQPPPDAHPLLRLSSGQSFSEQDANVVADEVELGYIPSFLMPAVAAFALDQWPALGRRITTNAERWRAISAYWPRGHVQALLGISGAVSLELHPDIARAAEEIRIPFDALNELLHLRTQHTTFRNIAPLFQDWALRQAPRPENQAATAIDLFTNLSHGRPLPNLLADLNEIRPFTRLAQEVGLAQRLSESTQQMWAHATRGWQLTLLLSLFPKEDFKPSATQLGWLVQYRGWLSEHLKQMGLSGLRRNRFGLATAPFHSLSFADDKQRWDDEFARRSTIWAAFRGVPLPRLARWALRDAIRAYSGSDHDTRTALQGPEQREQQAQLCRAFIAGYERSRDMAVRTVLLEFVLPLISFERREETVEEIFEFVGNEFPDYAGRSQRHFTFSPELGELLRQIVTYWRRKDTFRVIHEFYRYGVR